MPQARRKPAQTRGWRYSYDLTRSLMRTDREGVTLDRWSVAGIALVLFITKFSASVL